MAILSKIRDRSGFLIIIIGLAMFSFVVSPKNIIDFLANNNKDVIGKVKDLEVSYKDFVKRVETMKAQNKGYSSGAMSNENRIWDQMVREKIYESKLSEAGVVVGEAEIWEAILSYNEIKNSPQFKNDAGVFDEDKLKEYIANLDADTSERGTQALQGWINYEKVVKQNLLMETYNKLINVGVNVSEKEVLNDYIFNNTSVAADYVYYPFSDIADADIKVTEADVTAYIKKHAKQFETEATRNLKFVKFSFQASQEDEEDIKNELISLLEDREEYNKITKSTELVKGFKNTNEVQLFVEENDSDLPLVDKFQFEGELPTVIKEEITNAAIGAVVGPYKFSNHYKVSKVLAIQNIAESVKASHVLITYRGAQGADAKVTRSLADAEKLADSLLVAIKKAPKSFGTIASNYSSDPGSSAKKGDLGWFKYNAMVPAFRDFCFENKKGTIGIAKTSYGIHIINVEDQKDFKQAYKLATIARVIRASEKTENSVFEKAETLASALRAGGDFEALAKESGYNVETVNGLKELDVYVGAIGENRKIVKWSFNEDLEINSANRFDLDEKGYAVVLLSDKQEKGLKSAANAFSEVEPILIKEEKAKIIQEKMNGASLEAIASATALEVQNFSAVTLGAPTIPGVGIEPGVVSAAAASATEVLVSPVVGEKGVFALVTKSVTIPEATVDNVNVKSAVTNVKSAVSSKLYNGLKEEATIEDFRATYY